MPQFKAPYDVDYGQRDPLQNVDTLFPQRWSPRSFKKVDIPDEVITAIMEAARWSPSCFNEQPWRIITSTGPADFPKFLDLLTEGNQKWAKNASLLGFIVAKKQFSHNESPNSLAQFDCGATWLALTLQARLYGLYTHGMGGIHKAQIYDAFNIPQDEYEVIAGFALGVLDAPDKLPESLQEREIPSARKSLGEIWFKGEWG